MTLAPKDVVIVCGGERSSTLVCFLWILTLAFTPSAMEIGSDGFIKPVPNLASHFPSNVSSAPRSSLPSDSESAPSAVKASPSPSPLPHKKSFAETVAPSNHGVSIDARFVQVVGGKRSLKEGKESPNILNEFVVSPNDAMLKEISLEKSRLCNTAIFFACVDIEKCPPRKFLDNWFHNLWNLKLGLKISFCRQIQKGLFIIFFNNHEAQVEALK